MYDLLKKLDKLFGITSDSHLKCDIQDDVYQMLNSRLF